MVLRRPRPRLGDGPEVISVLLMAMLARGVSGAPSPAPDEVDQLLRRYDLSEAGQAQLAETRRRLGAVVERYAASGGPADYGRDADIAWLTRTRFPAVLLACRTLRSEKRPCVRRALLHIVASVGWRGAVPTLAGILEISADPSEREAVCLALSAAGSSGALRVLADHLKRRGDTETEEVIAACAAGIAEEPGRLAEGDRSTYRALVARFAPRVRGEAASVKVAAALLRLGDGSAVAGLLDRLADRTASRASRLAVIAVVETLPQPAVIQALAEASRDDDSEVGEAALGALKTLTRYEPPLPKPAEDGEPAPAAPRETAAVQPPTAAERAAEAARVLAWWGENRARVEQQVEKERRERAMEVPVRPSAQEKGEDARPVRTTSPAGEETHEGAR